jgi:hypothetical protein
MAYSEFLDRRVSYKIHEIMSKLKNGVSSMKEHSLCMCLHVLTCRISVVFKHSESYLFYKIPRIEKHTIFQWGKTVGYTSVGISKYKREHNIELQFKKTGRVIVELTWIRTGTSGVLLWTR